MEKERVKLDRNIGGIKNMRSLPDVIFIIDPKKEDIAVGEAVKLGIPVVALTDTNCDPEGIDYLIPGNDDAARAISLYCDLVARAALAGMSAQMGAAGIDIGALDHLSEPELDEGDDLADAEAETLEG